VKKRLLAMSVAVGMLLSVSASGAQADYNGENDYIAWPSDQTLSGMVARWARQENRRVSWETNLDFRIQNAQEFNAEARMPYARNTVEGFKHASETLHRINPDQPQLFGCLIGRDYMGSKATLVIRGPGQPGCEIVY